MVIEKQAVIVRAILIGDKRGPDKDLHVVGIIDSGIDYRHPAFRRPDGSTRILGIWDQRLVPQAGEQSPARFSFGVEYTSADIDAALATATPLTRGWPDDPPCPVPRSNRLTSSHCCFTQYGAVHER